MRSRPPGGCVSVLALGSCTLSHVPVHPSQLSKCVIISACRRELHVGAVSQSIRSEMRTSQKHSQKRSKSPVKTTSHAARVRKMMETLRASSVQLGESVQTVEQHEQNTTQAEAWGVMYV